MVICSILVSLTVAVKAIQVSLEQATLLLTPDSKLFLEDQLT